MTKGDKFFLAIIVPWILIVCLCIGAQLYFHHVDNLIAEKSMNSLGDFIAPFFAVEMLFVGFYLKIWK